MNAPATATAPARYLICNADDFGLSAGVNAGVARAHENGIVTSASLMVRAPAAAEAASYAAADGSLSLGLHLDLGEWVFRDGAWTAAYEVVDLDDRNAVEAELRAQLDLFRSLAGRDPTHLDSHQHIHVKNMQAEWASILLARELAIPLRHRSTGIAYRGDIYSQTEEGESTEPLTIEQMIEAISELPAGVTELGCHPGEGDDFESSYRDERRREVELLCDSRLRAAVERERITLCSFEQLPLHGVAQGAPPGGG